MIRLNRGEVPAVLIKNGAGWAAEYVSHLDRGETPPNALRYCYRHKTIKSALKVETNSKCAYCESKPTASQPGDIDHIRPISKNPHLICAWDNLTFSCRTCNHAKSDYDDDTAPLINPYVSDPEAHVLFFGPIATWSSGDFLAYRTIKQLRLNRPDLIEARAEAIERVLDILSLEPSAPDESTRTVIRNEAVAQAGEDREFSATIRSYLRWREQTNPSP